MASAIVGLVAFALIFISISQHIAVASPADESHALHSMAMQESGENAGSHVAVPCDGLGSSEEAGAQAGDSSSSKNCGSGCCKIGCTSLLMFMVSISDSSFFMREVHEMNLVGRLDGTPSFEFLRPPRV